MVYGRLYIVSCVKIVANDQDQRIVISTVAYHVHDLMTEKVKDFKKQLSHTEQPLQHSTGEHFTESKINLLCYGGFALHSMLLKRERYVTGSNKVAIRMEVELLRSIRVTEKEWGDLHVPSAIHYLKRGGLDIISHRMLPFFR